MNTLSRREWLKVVAGFGIAATSAGQLLLAGTAEPPQAKEGRAILLVDNAVSFH